MRMFYLAQYQIHTSNCSGLSTILKIQYKLPVLAEKVEQKVDVNHDESLTDLQTLIKGFILNFLHEYLMNLTSIV